MPRAIGNALRSAITARAGMPRTTPTKARVAKEKALQIKKDFARKRKVKGHGNTLKGLPTKGVKWQNKPKKLKLGKMLKKPKRRMKRDMEKVARKSGF